MASNKQVDLRKVEAFLYHEANLADESQYDDWLALWDDEDIIYWLPIGDSEYDPADRVSIIYDNRVRLEDRIARLNSGVAYAQEPKSHVRRVVSNIEIAPEEKPGEVVVHSNMVIGEVRRGVQSVYIARQTHVLRPAGDNFKIALKKVMLVNRDEALHNLTFLI